MYLFELFNYKYLNTYCKLFFLLITIIIILIIFASIICIISSYYIIKWLKNNLDYGSFFNYEYNKKSTQLLEKYGDYPVKKVYLVKHVASRLNKFVINIEALGNNLLIPNHTSFIIEVIMPNKLTKYILLEKDYCVNLSADFSIKEDQEIKQISRVRVGKKQVTLKSILKTTQTRIGDEKYFNWHILKNNSEYFTKEMLKTLKNIKK